MANFVHISILQKGNEKESKETKKKIDYSNEFVLTLILSPFLIEKVQ